MNFLKLCKEQKLSDNYVVQVRERTLNDIVTSAIAEVIEFNEACEVKYSHKTWKRLKKFNKEDKLEELADVLIFISQYINALSIDDRCLLAYEDDFDSCFRNIVESEIQFFETKIITLSLINDLSIHNVIGMFTSFAILTKLCEITKEDIIGIALKKIEFNKTRKDRVIV
ncbi:MAG: dUTP diphosphatase [Cetobacterium sp.]